MLRLLLLLPLLGHKTAFYYIALGRAMTLTKLFPRAPSDIQSLIQSVSRSLAKF